MWRETLNFLFFEGQCFKIKIQVKEDIVKILDDAISNLEKEKKEFKLFFKLFNSFFPLLSSVSIVL